MVNPPVTLAIASVDTEEDHWLPTRGPVTVENIRELPVLQRFLESFGVRPTYFTTYDVAAPGFSADTLRALHASGRAEVGAHLHPWRTPPVEEPAVPSATMLLNLPPALQRAKLETLTARLREVLGSAPRSFRAGRFGFGAATAAAAVACGYALDSSVTPYVSWVNTDGGPDFIGAPLDAYWLDCRSDVRLPARHGPLLEIPVSCGYSRRPFAVWAGAMRALESRTLRRLGAIKFAAGLRLVRPITLSPETNSLSEMLLLTRHLIALGVRHVHLFIHSSSLRPGLSPFARTTRDVQRLYAKLGAYFEGLEAMASVRFATVGEAGAALGPGVSTP